MIKASAAFGLVMLVGCAGHHRRPPEPGSDPASSSQTAVSISPQLAAFREQLRKADDATWRRLDLTYLQMAAALDHNFVRDLDYPDYLKQLDSPDPDTRTNGMCGLAASRSAAAVDHIGRALRVEADPWNRTIAVWCLRYCGRERHAAEALLKYLAECRDIDLGRALDENGQLRDFRAPFPVAGMEAFKALVALKGKTEMLDGDGWRIFVRRAAMSIHPEPIAAMNTERFKAGTGEPRSDPAATVRKWIDEMRE